jgi:hypothetical protein
VPLGWTCIPTPAKFKPSAQGSKERCKSTMTVGMLINCKVIILARLCNDPISPAQAVEERKTQGNGGRGKGPIAQNAQ